MRANERQIRGVFLVSFLFLLLKFLGAWGFSGFDVSAPFPIDIGDFLPQGCDESAAFAVDVCTRGDLDNDGDWDIFDILRLLDIALENPPPPSVYETCAADMDDDGDYDIFDILRCVDKVLA